MSVLTILYVMAQWGVMLPVLIPTMIICGIVNILSAKVSSDSMYLLLGIMFVAISIFFFVFSNRIHVRPTAKSGTAALIAGILLGLAIHDKIPSAAFGKVIYAFVGIGGIWIIAGHML